MLMHISSTGPMVSSDKPLAFIKSSRGRCGRLPIWPTNAVPRPSKEPGWLCWCTFLVTLKHSCVFPRRVAAFSTKPAFKSLRAFASSRLVSTRGVGVPGGTQQGHVLQFVVLAKESQALQKSCNRHCHVWKKCIKQFLSALNARMGKYPDKNISPVKGVQDLTITNKSSLFLLKMYSPKASKA